MKHWKLPSAILLALAIGAAGYWLGRITYPAVDRQRLMQLEQDNGDLKATVEKLRSLNAALENKPDAGPPPGSRSSAAPLSREHPYSDDIGTLSALRESLAFANKTIGDLQARAAEQQAQLDRAQQERERLAANESVLMEQLAASKQLVDTKDAELSRKQEQLVQFETAIRKLRDDAATAGSKSNQLLRTINELQEIYRRRESHLDTLRNRYREIAEQYRAFVSVLENRRGPEGTPGASMSTAGPELSRIQTSIAMAEEDLRQLNTLNAQALRIQKKLPAN
jgi:chromosome segregation ATPase